VVLVADPNFEAPAHDVDGLFLAVVDVERRAAVWPDLDDEVVECAVGLLAGDLEDQVAPRTRL
jgi:hypothetical protein